MEQHDVSPCTFLQPLMVSKEGYPVETHQVITDDGYILRMHRIPHGKRSPRHGCQMAIAKFLDCMCVALRASGLWLRYAALQNFTPGAIQGKEGIQFCHLATMLLGKLKLMAVTVDRRSTFSTDSRAPLQTGSLLDQG